VPLPGGNFPVDGVAKLVADLQSRFPFLSDFWALRLVRAYGTEALDILGAAKQATDLGQEFGATLTEAEINWLMKHEYARTAEDVIWRRNKLGLRLTKEQTQALDEWMAQHRRSTPAAAE
jgi:glycerol-3-phosphate dehydrogenase